MHAAVVRSFDHPPRYEEFADPDEAAANELTLNVLAAGLHPRVRSAAAGVHYTSTGDLPLIPGVDGVGLTPDGRRVYFLTLDSSRGSMAERVTARRSRCIPVPDGVDDATVAAAMNPAMSSWIGLRNRARLQPGQNVLVLGATGNAGQLAVQIAKALGAGKVIGVGRDPGRLDALRAHGADAVVSLDGDPDDVARAITDIATDIDVVIDYLWAKPTELVMPAVLNGRAQSERPLTWVQIGAITGPDLSLPSALLRANDLRIMGSGQGSVPTAGIAAELPGLMDLLATGALTVDARPVPLADVETAWNATTAPGERIVLVPAH